MTFSTYIPLFALFTTGLMLAQSPRLGVDLIASIPSSDLKDASTSCGYGTALYFRLPIHKKHSLQPHIDYIRYPAQTRIHTYTATQIKDYTINRTTESVGIGIDYVYTINNDSLRFFVTGGINAIRYEVKESTTLTLLDLTAISASNSEKTKFKQGYSLGIGFQFSEHWGSILRFNSVNLKHESWNRPNVNAYNFGVTYLF